MEKIDYTFNTDAAKKGLSKMKEWEKDPRNQDHPTLAPESIQEAINTSQASRRGIISVFDRAGKLLGQSLGNKGLPLSIETGITTKSSYKPNGEIYQTGGAYNNFKRGDEQVDNTQEDIGSIDRWIDNTQEDIVSLNTHVAYWNNIYVDMSQRADNYFQSNIQTFQNGWSIQESGRATWQQLPNGEYGLVPIGTLTQEEQAAITRFNSAQSEINTYWTTSNNALEQKRRYEEYMQSDVRNLSQLRDYRSQLGMQLSEDERIRYRYIMQGVDFEKKIQESQNSFKEIFGKEYTQESVRQNYYNAMDSLGGLMNGMQSGKIITEQDFKMSLQLAGAGLSNEEKVIFLGMVGANLEKLTYNWNKAQSGDFSGVKPLESMQALAKAYKTGESVPAGVCSSIHVAVATIAESWGIPAGTLTVSSKGVGHVVALMDINGKKVLSDYGKTYSAERVEDLFDTYAKINQGVVMRNYITDASGKIIGHVETPLTEAFRKEALSENQLSSILSSGNLSQDGANVVLYNNTKGFRGQYTFNNGIYVGGKYSEAQLISGVDAKTVSATVGKKWEDIDLGSGWKGSAFGEAHISQSTFAFDGQKSGIKTSTLSVQGGVRGEKVYGDGSNIYAGAGIRSIGQGSRPKKSEYDSIPIVGTGTSGESGINLVLGGNYQARATTRVGGEIGIQSDKGINVQNLGKSDLNPLTGDQYSTKTVKIGIEEKVGSGYVTLSGTKKVGPLSNETITGIGYTGEDIGARVEKIRINPTHVFGPTAQDVIRVNIEGNLGKGNNGKWFAGVEKGGITGKKGQAGVKWTF